MSWFEYELDKRIIQSGYEVDYRHRYANSVVGGAEAVSNIVESANKMHGVKNKFIDKLHKIYDMMVLAEKNAKNFDKYVVLPYFGSQDLNYILSGKSNLTDVYLVKSLYEDLCNYFEITPKSINVIDLYEGDGAKTDVEIGILEEKNRDYLVCLEDLYKEIIYMNE